MQFWLFLAGIILDLLSVTYIFWGYFILLPIFIFLFAILKLESNFNITVLE